MRYTPVPNMLVLLALMVQCWFSLADDSLFITERSRSSEEASYEDYYESESEEYSRRRSPKANRVIVLVEKPSTTTTTTTTKPEVCKTEYIVHREESMNWPTAKARCQDYGSSLVSIENRDVLEEVKRAIEKSGGAGEFWTSGTDVDEEGRWVWSTTGEEMTFMNWATTEEVEPNNKGPWGSENCLQIYPEYGFNDRDCKNVHINYICQRQICI